MNPTFMLRCEVFVIGLVTAIYANAANAHSDIFLASLSGKVASGGANELGTVEENYDLSTRVFEGVMLADFPPFNPADYGRDEPGFDALASGSPLLPVGATALPPNAAVTLTLPSFCIGSNSDVMYYWNGVGVVDFQPIATAQPGIVMTVDPNPIGTTNANGFMHEHPVFTVDNGGAGVPADGVYLTSPRASVAGLGDSDRFFMVWLVDALLEDEDAAEGLEESLELGQSVYLGKDFAFFEDAVSYVQDQVIPEPATGMLAGIAMFSTVANIRLRRRAR